MRISIAAEMESMNEALALASRLEEKVDDVIRADARYNEETKLFEVVVQKS